MIRIEKADHEKAEFVFDHVVRLLKELEDNPDEFRHLCQRPLWNNKRDVRTARIQVLRVWEKTDRNCQRICKEQRLGKNRCHRATGGEVAPDSRIL